MQESLDVRDGIYLRLYLIPPGLRSLIIESTIARKQSATSVAATSGEDVQPEAARVGPIIELYINHDITTIQPAANMQR